MSLKQLGELGEAIQKELDSFSSDIEDVQEIVDEVEPRLELIEKKLQSNIENSFTKQLDKHTEILKKQIGIQGDIIEDHEKEIGNIKKNIKEIVIPEAYNDSVVKKNIENKADKTHKHEIKDVTGLSETLEEIKEEIDEKIKSIPVGKTSVGGGLGIRSIGAGVGITVDESNPKHPIVSSDLPEGLNNPLLLLGLQNFYVDTYSANNQILEGHREDGTTIENTYLNNLLQTAVYTFPDATVVTMTVSYDGNDRVISALYS